MGIGTRCELRVRELGTPSSSTESYCHRLPDLHSCPHFGDLKIEGFNQKRRQGEGIWLGFGSKMQRKGGQCSYYLHLGQGKWQPGQESSRQSHKSRPECSKTPWEVARLRKQILDWCRYFHHLVNVTLLRHLVIIDASLFGCRGRGCTIPSRHLIWLKLQRDPLSVTNIGLYPRFSFSVAWWVEVWEELATLVLLGMQVF